MPPRVSTGDRDAVLRQIRWCAAVQTLVRSCHCQLEENPVGDVEPMQLVVQYMTQAAIKLPSASDKRTCDRSRQRSLRRLHRVNTLSHFFLHGLVSSIGSSHYRLLSQ